MSELELWNELGNLYFKTGACTEAIRTYQKVIDLDPGYGEPYINLASIYFNQGRYAEAIPLFKKGIEFMQDATSRASAWNQLGEAYRKIEDYANACAAFWKAIELDPQEPAFQDNLTEAELSSRISKSEPTIEPEQNNLPSAEPVIIGILPTGIEATGVAEPDKACWVFEENNKAVKSDGDTVDGSEPSPVILGSRSLDVGDGTLPIDPPETVVSIDGSAQALLRLGILHWRKRELARAIPFLKTALDAAHRSQDQFHEALSFYALAQVETDQGKIEDAIKAFQSTTNLAPERFFPWNKLGNLNCMLNRYEDARAAFQEGIEHNPKDSVSWNGLADVYHKLGRNEDAIAAYQLGNVFEKQTYQEDPLEEFEKKIESNQENPQIWNEAGDIYYNIKAYDDAIASYRQAIQLDPAIAVFQANLAKAEQALENSKSRNEPALPETLTETNPAPPQICKPFIVENPSQENKKLYMAQPDPTISGQALEFEATPEMVSSPANAAADPDPEAAYWVFKSVPPHPNVQQSVRQYLPQIVEIGLDNTKPQPALGSKTPQARSFSCDQVLTDTFHENASILVQLTPRNLKPAGIEESTNLLVTQPDQEKASTKADSVTQNSCSAPAETKTVKSAPLQTTTENPPADQASLDLQILENDISAYRRVTEINPKNDRAWDTLGNMYENIGLHGQAIAAFEQAIALAPHKEVYYYHLGIALAYQMQYNQAIQALETVIALNPRYMLAHCALAGYYRRLGRETDAQEHAQIARPSMEFENEYNRACFESISGDADRAIALLEIALDKKQIQPGMVRSDPDLDFIRKDSRFEALLAKNQVTSE